MVKKLNPRHGSMQFWPRKRAHKLVSSVKRWILPKEANLVGFLGYKVGMAHVMSTEKYGKRTIDISTPVTIIECPSIKIFSARLYKHGIVKSEILAPKLDKELSKKVVLPKKYDKKLEDGDFDEVRIIVYTQPKVTTMGKKKPDLVELGIGGDKAAQIQWVNDHFGKEINISDVFRDNMSIDVRGVTKGKGFQGPVKRFGVNLRSHKAEKGQRRVGARSGGWNAQAHMMYRVPQPGKMGYHRRTEYNKFIIKISDDVSFVAKKEGFIKYGVVRNPFILVKGSILGSAKRPIVITNSIRPNKKVSKQKYDIKEIIL